MFTGNREIIKFVRYQGQDRPAVAVIAVHGVADEIRDATVRKISELGIASLTGVDSNHAPESNAVQPEHIGGAT